MNWIAIARFPLDKDLSQVHDYLIQSRIPHKFSEEQGEQVLSVLDIHHKDPVLAFIAALDRGEIRISEDANNSHHQNHDAKTEAPNSVIPTGRIEALDPLTSLKLTPVNTAVLLLGIVGFFLVQQTGPANAFSLMGFLPPEWVISHPAQTYRLLSPAFLHFDWLHIIFNGLWIYDLGRRLELYLGKVRYFLLFLATALGGNLLQYYWSGGATNFGGLSGAVFGYVAAVWVFKRHDDNVILNVPEGIFLFAPIFLVLGYVGFFDVILNGGIANGAHTGGLLAGLICSIVFLGKSFSPGKLNPGK